MGEIRSWRGAHPGSIEDTRGGVDDYVEEGDGADFIGDGEDLLQGRERTLGEQCST